MSSRTFELHVNCYNCQRPSTREMHVPIADGAPRDVDEFLEQLERKPVPFNCRHCGSNIGELVGVTMTVDPDPEFRESPDLESDVAADAA